MAAYAAVVSLMNNMEQIMNHPRLSNCFDNQQIQSLLQKAGSLLEFIEGYGRVGLFSKEAEALERQITSAAYVAEDVIESHVVDQIHAGTLCSLDLQHVIQDMGAVAGKAMEVKEKEGVKEEEEQSPIHPTLPLVGGTGKTAAMVGLEDELTQLLDSLTDYHSNRHVISIVGMGGTGKTTLAQNLYAHPHVKEHFDIRAWASISQQYNSQDILSQLLSCPGKSNSVGELGEQVHKTLYGRRYLIVLDDIWGVEAWDEVGRYFPDNGNSSRVVLTTRLSNVANTCGSACFDMNLLDEEKSWKLFCRKALFPRKDDPLHLEDVGKRIVKSCKGLALSIVVIGGLLLKSPRTVRYWENILDGLSSTDSKEKQEGLDALSLSYTHLPPHLKPCFLYLGGFTEDSEIRASKITKLWVAEGFIKPMGSRVLEEIAEDYLKDLSDKNLILGVVKRRHNGTIKSFSIHDLLRDMCVKVAEQTNFFHVMKWRPNGTERRIFYLYSTPFADAVTRPILTTRSLLSRVRVWVDKCRLLRVLDGKEKGSDKSMAEVWGNVNLRYLAHKMNYCRQYLELPSSACLLWNLQTLMIDHSRPLMIDHSRPLNDFIVLAPLEIWKMRQLRHVKCENVYLPHPWNMQDCMENLQTLAGALNLRLSEEVCQIIPNIKKLGLIFHPELQGYDDSLTECLRNLDRLHKLESLNMEFKPRLDWELSSKLAFPLSLKKLRFGRCRLCWEDLSKIGSLPQLQVLHLSIEGNSKGDRWSPISGQFLRLKYLKIDECDFRSWDADSSHFPALEKLVLCDLYYLEGIPLEIGEISTLELIRVKGCKKAVAISALKIKKYQLENYDNDTLQIEVKLLGKIKAETFKKSMEAEELAFDLLNKLEIYFDAYQYMRYKIIKLVNIFKTEETKKYYLPRG